MGESLDAPVLLPSVYAVRDLVGELSGLEVADTLTLVLELYAVHRQMVADEPFDKFLGWGELLVNDFSEIDLQNVNAAHLYSNLADLKEIENRFGLDKEDALRISRFWALFSTRELPENRQKFMATWNSMLSVYTQYKKSLSTQGMAYEGMAWQAALEAVRRGEVQARWNKVYFAGFYGMSKVHAAIVRSLGETAEILSDADSYYADDPDQEAGFYFHRNKRAPAEFKWKEKNFASKKSIRVAGVPLLAGQAKYAGSLVRKLVSEKKIDPSRTVIVLPDEGLLSPLLSSLPPEAGPVSVTMGYPLKLSASASLVEALYRLSLSRHANDRGNTSLFTGDLVRLLGHPYLKAIAPKAANEAIDFIREKKLTRIPTDTRELLDLPAPLRVLLGPGPMPSDILQSVQSLLLTAASAEGHAGPALPELERRMALDFSDEIGHLASQMHRAGEITGEQTAWMLLRRIVRFLRISLPGGGDGIQVMGILETRALDFETVFVLSMNEGILPPSSAMPSYIPPVLRSGFGIPGYSERDAVYAYHFYRLLQRATDIFLVHDTEIKSLRGGEKSRFINQLAYELKSKAPEAELEFISLSVPDAAGKTPAITVDKSEDIIQLLHKKYTGPGAGGFSPSALTQYLSCPLRFYFSRIAKLDEPVEITETIPLHVFGNLLHDAMKRIYAEKQKVNPDTISQLKKQVAAATEAAFRAEFSHSQEKGMIYVNKQIIGDLAGRILEADRLLAPFEIESLEQRYEAGIQYSGQQDAVISGKVDRIHHKDGIRCIVDYKTGQDKIRKETDVDSVFSDPDNKAEFQLLFYSLLYGKNHPDRPIRAGIYKARKLSDGIQYIHGGEPVSAETLAAYEKRLAGLIGEIMDPSVPFSQTDDERRCVYCAYKEICNRQG